MVFAEEESENIAREINKSGADILFVGFSSPKKKSGLISICLL